MELRKSLADGVGIAWIHECFDEYMRVISLDWVCELRGRLLAKPSRSYAREQRYTRAEMNKKISQEPKHLLPSVSSKVIMIDLLRGPLANVK